MGAIGGLFSALAITAIYILLMGEMSVRQSEYDRGYADREALQAIYEMSPDDERVLAELKKAMKLHLKETGLYKSGDVKRIDSIRDFAELKDKTWELAVRRREKK